VTRKLIPLFVLVALLGVGALGANSAFAIPCNPDTDPDCDPGGGQTVTTVQVDLDVAPPPAGTVTDDGGQISCVGDCHGDYSYIRTCEDFDCTIDSVDLVSLSGSGGPSGYTAHFTYCAANLAGTACSGPVTDCGLGACQISMDDDYRASLDWVDTTAPSQASLSGPSKVGPSVRQFTASGTDNSPAGVIAMRFELDGVSQPLDVSAPFQFDAPVESLVEGPHTLVAFARDGTGNEGAASTQIGFTVDRHTSAAISAPAAGGHFSSPPLVTFTRDDTDDADTTCQTLQGTTVIASTACTTSFTPDIGSHGDGDYIARVIVTDDVGNTATDERGFKIDTGDPNVTINSPTADQHVRSPFTPSITAADGVTPPGELIVQCRVGASGAFGACGQLTLADGSYTLFARAQDKAGNERVESVAFIVDSTGPTVSITAGPANDAIVGTTSVTYRWTASDGSPPVTQSCKLDAAAFGACSGNGVHVLNNLSEGSHTFALKLTDALGNSRTVERDLFVNAVRPAAAITSGPGEGDVVRTRDVTVGFSASGGAVSCSLDSETAFRACSTASSDALRGLADGAHTFRVRVVDESNDSVVRSRTFRVDTSVAPPPITEILKQILNPTLSTDFDAFKGYTRYKRLVVKRVPKGATVTVKCKGKKCPARSFKKTRAGNVKLTKFVKKKLRVGTTLTIRVTKPGAIGKQFVIKIRRGKRPLLKITQIA
jgi:hypothetical protein